MGLDTLLESPLGTIILKILNPKYLGSLGPQRQETREQENWAFQFPGCFLLSTQGYLMKGGIVMKKYELDLSTQIICGIQCIGHYYTT